MSEKTASEETTLVEFEGRMIEMRKPSEGAVVVMARVSRGLPSSAPDPATLTESHRRKLMRDVGLLGKLIDEMIVSESDRDWLDDGLISDEFDPAAVFGLVTKAMEQFNAGPAPTTGPVKRATVRRAATANASRTRRG